MKSGNHPPNEQETVQLSVVIPAAGLSTRLGRAKQQLPFGNTTLLGHTITTAMHFINATPHLSGEAPIVVSNAHDDSLPPQRFDKHIVKICNNTPEQGILATLRCTQSVTNNADAVLVLLGDQYRVTSDSLQALFNYYLKSPEHPIAAQYLTVADQFNLNPAILNPSMPGLPNSDPASDQAINIDDAILAPPMIWPQHYWQELLASTHPRGGQTLLHTSAARALPMPEAAFDVDTPNDVYLLQQWLQSHLDATPH